MVYYKKKNIALSIILSLVTFGIYPIIWQYHLIQNVRTLKGSYSGGVTELLCCMFVPFYSLYWWFSRGEYVKTVCKHYNYSVMGSGILYLLLGLFGFGIVSYAIMQRDFNNIPDETTEVNNKNPLDEKQLAEIQKRNDAKTKTAIQYLIYGAIIVAVLAATIGLCALYQYLCTGPWAI